LFGGPFNSPISPAAPVSSGLNEGPVIRIRYV
jgi:hypothetical protein